LTTKALSLATVHFPWVVFNIYAIISSYEALNVVEVVEVGVMRILKSPALRSVSTVNNETPVFNVAYSVEMAIVEFDVTANLVS
jgi:hypothetical protein